MVNWKEAVEFCRKATADLRQQKRLGADEVIRLPSEAEWEYACRAGTATPYSCPAADVKEFCWFKGNSKGYDPPVDAKKPNPWGLYDMHGYIWEWCADAWHPSYDGAPTDGSVWGGGDAKEHVLRGGSWNDPATRCRSRRDRLAPPTFAATRSASAAFARAEPRRAGGVSPRIVRESGG